MARNERGQALVTVFIVIGLLFFGPAILRWWLGALQANGIDVARATCEWNPDRDRFEVTLVVYNTEHMYKFMLANARTRFHPPLGKRWPDQTSRQMFRVATKSLPVVFEPDGNIEEKLIFTLPPELEEYGCGVSVEVLGQERYRDRPSIRDIETAPDRIRKAWLYRVRQRLMSR